MKLRRAEDLKRKHGRKRNNDAERTPTRRTDDDGDDEKDEKDEHKD